MRVTVNVDQSLIEHGVPMSEDACPIALGVVAAVPGITDISAVHSVIAIRVGDQSLRADLPESAAEFMDRFDVGLDVEPISFDLTFEPSDPTS